MGLRQARALAAAIHCLAEHKPGANFRFGVSFNCGGKAIPFFPAAAAPAAGRGFAIGTENNAVLHAAFAAAAAAAAADPGASVLDAAQAALRDAMAAVLLPLQSWAEGAAAATGLPFLGIDASIAPALEPPSIPDAYELLGLGAFGGAGTLAISGARVREG